MTIANEQNGTIEYGYDQRGLLASIKYPSTNYAIYAHDALGRVTTVSYPDTNTAIASYDYLGGRIIGKTFTNADLKYEASVDALGRIGSETIKTISTPVNTLKTTTYGYATHTNRLSARNSVNFGYDTLGKLTSEDTSSYTSDLLGNPTNAGSSGYVYTKDKEDRITEVKNAQSAALADYTYDVAGRRAKKTINNVDTNFVYNLNGAILSEISTGSPTREYVYGAAGEAIYTQTSQAGSGRYLLTDFRNSVIAKTNFDGSLTIIDYNAWGEPTVAQGGNLEGLSVL